MRFSLILATVDRPTRVIERFLRSVVEQEYRDTEVIIVDQNKDDRLRSLVERYEKRLSVKWVHSNRGLSRARNVGLRFTSGDVVAFPDDDCWYPPGLLVSVAEFLRTRAEYHGVVGLPRDIDGQLSFGSFADVPGSITPRNVWTRCTSATMFIRSGVAHRARFDEALGLGAGTPWGAAEDIDYPVQLLKRGHRLYYDPTLVVGHPRVNKGYDWGEIAKAFRYSMGMGRVLRKHKYPFWYVGYLWMRAGGGALAAIARGRAGQCAYHVAVLAGRVGGWLWWRA